MLISQQIHTAKELITDWLQLISELSLQRDKLAELASSQNESDWRCELDTAQNLKVGSNWNICYQRLFHSYMCEILACRLSGTSTCRTRWENVWFNDGNLQTFSYYHDLT